MNRSRFVLVLPMLISLFASYLVFAALPISADAADQLCWEYSVSFMNPGSTPGTVAMSLTGYNSSESTEYNKTFAVQPGMTETGTLTELFPVSDTSFVGTASGSGSLLYVPPGIFSRVANSMCGGPCHIDDGRINAYDLGAPLAAYCTADKGMAVWDIDSTGHGTLAFSVTGTQISAALSKAISSGQNVLVGQGLGDSLYALSSNQLTLTGPDVSDSKTYDFITTPDVCA